MNASEVIRNLRKSRNITQEQLAEAICVERSSIGKYETGTLPSVDVLIRIADYFDVSVDYILNDTVITPSAFSKRLKDLRNKRKLSQNDIADILNVKSNTISQYENGRREPDFSSLCRIADYFGVTTDYLLGIEDTPDIVLPQRTLFGDQLKKYRSMANLSQSTLAKLLNVSQQAVGSWETNRTSPSPEMIVEIASVLNVSTDTLLGVASDSVCGSSNLSSPANEKSRKIQCLCGFPALDLFDDRFAPGALQRFFRGFLSSGCRQIIRLSPASTV